MEKTLIARLLQGKVPSDQTESDAMYSDKGIFLLFLQFS